MFERLKNALARLQWSTARSAPLAQWADQHGLGFRPLIGGAYALSGHWHGQAVRLECMAPSRPFIQGMELMARADLGLSVPGSVVLMNRSLKLMLEQRASELYSQYTDALQTTAQTLPDEIRWLAMYRDAGWTGPDRQFWARYAVLTAKHTDAAHSHHGNTKIVVESIFCPSIWPAIRPCTHLSAQTVKPYASARPNAAPAQPISAPSVKNSPMI